MYFHYLEKNSVDLLSDEEVSENKTVKNVYEIFTVQYENIAP